MSKPRSTPHPASHAQPSRDGLAPRTERGPSAPAARGNTARRVGIVSSFAVLVGAAYLIIAPRVLSSYLRREAERAGMELTFASVSTMYPGDLRIDDLELRLPSAGVTLLARSLEAWPRWRALLGNEPPIEVIRASDVELTWADGSVGQFDVQLRVSGESGEAGSGWMALEGPQATLTTRGKTIDFALQARLELQHRGSEASGPLQLTLGDGVIDASDIVLTSPQRPRAPAASRGDTGLRVILRVEAGRFVAPGGLSVLGRAHVKGPDAGAGLDWANADAGARWMLDELVGQPFELEAALHLCDAGLEIDDIRVRSGVTQGEGALRYDDGAARGAVLLRRGALNIGVTLLPDGAQALLSPEPRWLARERDDLGEPCASAVR